jgi:hypothetical protein
MGCQLGQVAGRPPAFTQRLVPEPGDHPDHIHGRRRQELLEVHAREADVPTLAGINAPDPMRETALHPCQQGILGFEGHRLLPLARRLDRLVVRLPPDSELVGGVLG